MTFLAPGALALLLLVPLVWFWPRRLEDMRHGALRAAVFILLILALAHPVSTTDSGSEHHALVIDRRGSPDAADLAALSARGALAATAQVSLFDVEEGRTLGAALEAALRAVPAGAAGALTLVGDGRAPANDYGRAVTSAQARGIPIHTVDLASPAGDVRPTSLHAVGELRIGATSRVEVEVHGGPANVVVSLSDADGELVAAPETFIPAEGGVVSLSFEPEQAGFHAVSAHVEVTDGRDLDTSNQELGAMLAVQDPLRVLYVGERTQGGGAELGRLVGAGFQIDASGGQGLPTESAQLAGYDLVVMDDCPAESVPHSAQNALVEAVQRTGTGLFFSGGEASFGPGGWHEEPLTEVLPVESLQKEEKRDPSVTLCIIIDTSGSMGGNRVQLAKEVSRLAIRRLLPHDKVGIVEFYGAKRWAAPIQPASNHIELERALNRLAAGGGTVILPAIEECYYGMKNVQTRYKHVMILTDGGVETGEFEPLLRRMAEDGMNVSTVLIGPDAHSEFLVTLANWGKGRFYSVPNRFNLPEILLKQPASAKLPAYRPTVTRVTASGGRSWWGDVDSRSVPDLGGFVETKLKPGAEPVLETSEGKRPVLASWRHGSGRVTAFTSEPAGAGTDSWGGWDGFGPFLARALRRTAADDGSPYRVETTRSGASLAVTVERKDARVPAPSVTWRGSAAARALTLAERAPGVWTAELILAGTDASAAVELELTPENSGQTTQRVVAPAPVPYSNAPVRLDLARLATSTRGMGVSAGETLTPVAGVGGAPARARAWRPLLALVALLCYLAVLGYRGRPLRGAGGLA